MKLGYLTALVISSALTVGAIGANLPVQANPCAATTPGAAVNPCAANPCAANPCAANPCAANPCAANPCAANPCAANPCAANPCASAAIATGTFQGVDKETQGTVSIVEENGKRYLELDSGFESANGPDLFVLLHRETVPQDYDAAQYVNLGELQATAGQQRYEIPEGVSVADFRSAVIWCRQFNVTFGYAAL